MRLRPGHRPRQGARTAVSTHTSTCCCLLESYLDISRTGGGPSFISLLWELPHTAVHAVLKRYSMVLNEVSANCSLVGERNGAHRATPARRKSVITIAGPGGSLRCCWSGRLRTGNKTGPTRVLFCIALQHCCWHLNSMVCAVCVRQAGECQVPPAAVRVCVSSMYSVCVCVSGHGDCNRNE